MNGKLASIALLIGVLALCTPVGVAAVQDNDACLACHADKGHTIEFPEGGRIEAFVDRKSFEASVHGGLACTQCHEMTLTGNGHEQQRFRSEWQFKVRYSRICRRCHLDGQIDELPVHSSLLQQEAAGRVPICTDCHPAHAIVPTSGGLVLAGEAARCVACHPREGAAIRTAASGPGTAGFPLVHASLTCTGCHAGYSRAAHPQQPTRADGRSASRDLCRRCHFDKYTKTLESIHFALLSQGRKGTPDCVDCHGAHRVTSLTHDRVTSAARCGGCHKRLYQTYAKSVHGDALVHGSNQDVPVCADCHRAHDIGDPLTTSYADNIPLVCGNCHANPAIVGKYGLSTDVVRTYLEDFHGSTVSIYRVQGEGPYRPKRPIAVCTDCHGTHDIQSLAVLGTAHVKKLMLVKCRQCHAGASANFPDAWLSHYTPSLTRTPALYVVDKAYSILVPLMVLGILVQVAVHARRHAAGPRPAPPAVGQRIRRFSRGRILEHLAVAVLFLVLAATGLAQLYHQFAASQWLVALLEGVDQLRQVHHYAGLALGVLLLLHLVTAAHGVAMRNWHLSMLISRKDFSDAAHHTRYGLGLTSTPPAPGWYDFKEKFTYWLTLGCAVIMFVTGLVLWFPVVAARFLPGEAIALAASMHSHQALVVVLLVCAWHVYNVTLSPEAFPLDTSIFTGHTRRVRVPPGGLPPDSGH